MDLSAETTENILTSIGLEVESMEQAEQIPGGLKGVVVGLVTDCDKHPDADRLSVTKVDVGLSEPLQIVCGAPNVRKGQKVMVATVGSRLVTSSGEEIKIKRSKIRGVESSGMICAEDELGLGASHDGIMVLDEDAVVGRDALSQLGLESDIVFEIGLTPNRIDAASHIGVARDLYAYLKLNDIECSLKYPETEKLLPSKGDSIDLEVVAEHVAQRYMGVTLENIRVEESPDWLKKRLIAIGLRPINNIVDITNYILHETGQPLHAFDADKIAGGKVVVRMASEGEKFTTLDGIERVMTSSDLMICDTEKPMCIAGVFGGEYSGVTESTTKIFLESAWFNPVFIRKTSKRLGLKTDASFRYERGADPEMVTYAAYRAISLMSDLAGANVVGEVREIYHNRIEKKRVELDFARMERLIGKSIGANTIISILTNLDFEIISREQERAEVLVPTYRVDVYRECDVVEEILRIYGYNNIDLPEQVRMSVNSTQKPDPEQFTSRIAELLSGNGFMECMNNSLTKSSYYSSLKKFPEDHLAMILNPLSSDLNAMRQTLIFNGLETIAYNINRQASELRLYEIGNVYSFKTDHQSNSRENLSLYDEEQKIAIFITGNGTQYWRNNSGKSDYFQLKGYVELLLKRFGVEMYDLQSNAAPSDIFQEGVTYSIGEKELVTLGAISQNLLKQSGIKQAVFAAEISWKQLFKAYKRVKTGYAELPKYPEVKRDLALLIDEGVSYAQLRECALSVEKKTLKNVVLFDIYRGDKIPDGKKQYAISLTLQDREKTMTDTYVDAIVNKILKAFIDKYGAVLR